MKIEDIKCRDYYIPDLKRSEGKRSIGKWAGCAGSHRNF